MKRIISIGLVIFMLLASVLAMIPASAADSKTINIDWTAYDYVVYNENAVQVDESVVLENFTVTKTADTLKLDRTGSGIQSNSYIASVQFAITATTNYTYEVMAKNNYTTKYSGVPFAIDTEGNVYFIYGSFNNNNDSTDENNNIVYPDKSYVIGAKADFWNKYPDRTGDELDSMYFAKLQQTDGFASFKFVYEGLTVKVYAKNESGSYVQMGEDIPLPDGSKVCFGVFSRDNSNGGNRTTTVKNGKITANNDESISNMMYVIVDKRELIAEIAAVEKNYKEVDYTAESYTVFEYALAEAKEIESNIYATNEDVREALDALRNAVLALKLKKADTTKLRETIAKAETLKEIEWTVISYKMVMKAVDDAKVLLEKTDLKQSEVDSATYTIESRIDALVSSGIVKADEDDKLQLSSKLSEATTIKSMLNSNDYPVESWNALVNAIDYANGILVKSTLYQSEVNDAYDKLESALSGLVSYVDIKKAELLNTLGAKKTNDNNEYSAESYAKYSELYDVILESINNATTLDALNAIDVNTSKAVAEAKLVTVLLATKADKLVLLGDKLVNNGKYTSASYNIYSLKYDEIKSNIDNARTLDELNSINIAILKAAAEELLILSADVETEKETSKTDIETSKPNVETEKTDTETVKDENGEDQFQELGCGSAISLSALAVIGIIGVALTVKKKED